MGTDLSVHDYWLEPHRYTTVAAWAEARGELFSENLIPPVAVLVKRAGVPVAFLCAYQAVGIGVAIIDWMITAPGQVLSESRDALLRGIEGIKAVLRSHDYGIVIAYAPAGAARYLEQAGWSRGGDFTQLAHAI